MGFIDLIPGVIKIVGKALGIGDKVKAVVDALEGAPPEVRAQIAKDLQTYSIAQRAFDVEELRVMLSENLAMVQSDDKYVKRARPTGLYIFYLVSAGIAVAMIFGVKVDPTAILTVLGPLAGVGGTYVYARTKEKLGNGN